MASYALDQLWWDRVPEDVPPCRHCGKYVSPKELVPAVKVNWLNWYFCTACASDAEILRNWERIRNDMTERPIGYAINVTDC